MKALRNLDLSTLRSFVTIAETKNMTRAATRLHLTQSAISMQIKRVEESLDLTLFERTKKGMETTSAGEQLLHYAKQMVELNDEAWSRLTASEYEGRITLGVPADIINPQVPNVLRAFSQAFPRVQVTLASSLSHALLEQFDKGEFDVVLTTLREPDKNGEVISTQRLLWTGAIDGTAWNRRPLPIGFSQGCAFRKDVLDALNTNGIDWFDVVAAEDEIAGIATISADLCVGAELEGSDLYRREFIDHEGTLPQLPDYSIVMYRAERSADSPASVLGDYLQEAYR